MSLSDQTLDVLYEHDFNNNLTLEPKLLSHPNIPKPLHEVNPRNILGEDKWNIVRQNAYASTGYRCAACGVYKSQALGKQWLEAHESYDIDYERGIVKIDKIVPLCHYCHNFIHSGRLSMIIGKEKTKQEVIDILEHGFKILSKNHLNAFYFTVDLALELGANTYSVQPSKNIKSSANWGDWVLVYQDKEYGPKYKTYEEWLERYAQ